MDKLLTVIVPSYNVERYLEDVLKTYIIPEVFPLLEVLIVNDGSKDRTQEIAESFCRAYPECFKLINKENGGHGSTINTGIRYASGKYIRVIDGDDWVDSDCLKRYIEKLRKLDADLILSPFNYVSDDGVILREKKMPSTVAECEDISVCECIDEIKALDMMHAFAAKTEILGKIPPISENCFYVDNEFINFPLAYVKTVAFINECVYQYRYGTAGQSVALHNTLKNYTHFYRVFERLAQFEPSCREAPLCSVVRKNIIVLFSRVLELYLFMPSSHEKYEELLSIIAKARNNYPWVLSEIHFWKYRLLLKASYPLYWLLAKYTQIRLKQINAE